MTEHEQRNHEPGADAGSLDHPASLPLIIMLKEPAETETGEVIDAGKTAIVLQATDEGYRVAVLPTLHIAVFVPKSSAGKPTPIRDYYEPLAEVEDWGVEPAGPVVTIDGVEEVAMRCRDCLRPAYYDLTDDWYHHADDPSRGCFLIGPEERDPDLRHPLLAASRQPDPDEES